MNVMGEVLEKLPDEKGEEVGVGGEGCYLVECCIIPATDCIAKPHFKINWKQFSNAKPKVRNPQSTSSS